MSDKKYNCILRRYSVEGNQKINPAVKTGDYANPLLWVIILLLAVISVGTAVFYKRKNQLSDYQEEVDYLIVFEKKIEKL